MILHEDEFTREARLYRRRNDEGCGLTSGPFEEIEPPYYDRPRFAPWVSLTAVVVAVAFIVYVML